MPQRVCKRTLFLSVSLLIAAAAGCKRPGSGQAEIVITPEAAKEAQEIFAARCSTCHGLTGQGDGPGSAALTPKPRNFTDKMWQSNVTDKHIETIIQFGGAAVGKSPTMVANPDLVSKPAVVAALRAHIRSLGK